ESDDLFFHSYTVRTGQSITLKSRAKDDALGLISAFVRADNTTIRTRSGALYFFTCAYFGGMIDRQRQFRHLVGGTAKIDDAGTAHPKAGDTGTVWLYLLDLIRSDALEVLDPIRDAALVDLVQTRQFIRLHGHNDLSAHIMFDAVLLGEGHKFTTSLCTGLCLLASGHIVDPTVDHTAVMPGLVIAQHGFLFQ